MLFPDVTKKDLKKLPGQFCVGRRQKIEFTDKEIFSQQAGGNFEKIADITEDIRAVLKEDDPENVESIDGGPACFGDSGELRTDKLCSSSRLKLDLNRSKSCYVLCPLHPP